MATEVYGSIEAVIEMIDKQLERAEQAVIRNDRAIKQNHYGPDWGTTKTELVDGAGYARGERWGLTRAKDLILALDALSSAELNKTRLPEGHCTTCGSLQQKLPEYCTTQDCGNRAQFKIKDKHGNEWLTCTTHLQLNLNAVGESTIEAV